MERDWYYSSLGESFGPFTAVELRDMAIARELPFDAHIKQGIAGEWQTALTIEGLFDSPPLAAIPDNALTASTPPRLPDPSNALESQPTAATPHPPALPRRKSTAIAWWLGGGAAALILLVVVIAALVSAGKADSLAADELDRTSVILRAPGGHGSAFVIDKCSASPQLRQSAS